MPTLSLSLQRTKPQTQRRWRWWNPPQFQFQFQFQSSGRANPIMHQHASAANPPQKRDRETFVHKMWTVDRESKTNLWCQGRNIRKTNIIVFVCSGIFMFWESWIRLYLLWCTDLSVCVCLRDNRHRFYGLMGVFSWALC